MEKHPLADGYHDVPAGKIAAVVTSLEMRRPIRSKYKPQAAVDLVRVTNPDLGWYRGLFGRIGEDWLWFSRLKMSDAELSRVIRDPDVEVHAVRIDGRDEGLVELDFRKPRACELSFFGLTRPHLGKGIGRWMMDQAIGLAWEKPIDVFWVHTCTLDAPGALAFYMKAGFTPFRRQIEIADDPRVAGKLPRTAAAQFPIL